MGDKHYLADIDQHARPCSSESLKDWVNRRNELFQHDDLIDGLLSRLQCLFDRLDDELQWSVVSSILLIVAYSSE